MPTFLQKYAASVTGSISGFDRLVLRGTLRLIANVGGMHAYLSQVGVLLKDFGAREGITVELEGASLNLGRPAIEGDTVKLASASGHAFIARRDGSTVSIITCVDPCISYDIHRNRAKKQLELVARRRKCLHIYKYFLHPTLGFMHARIQTWAPYSVQICLNGREWLSRQMDANGLGYLRKQNCFTWLEDSAAAQKLLDEQVRTDWPGLLRQILQLLHPGHDQLFSEFPLHYYWSAHQSEWATDVLFKDPETLACLYPQLVRHGITTFGSNDVMRFLGKRLPAHGGVHGHFAGQIVSDIKTRPEGVRIKHRVNGNSVKLYDKQGSVLRVETTINNNREFKVYRASERSPEGPMSWQRMRKGVADLHRRTQISQACNDRYLDALASLSGSLPLGELVARVTRPGKINGQRCRPLHPWSQHDAELLQAISDAKFTINGFRNRDLCQVLFHAPSESEDEQRRRSGAITRKLRLLRGHRLIRKVPSTHRYVVTPAGRRIITALLAARLADVTRLTAMAA